MAGKPKLTVNFWEKDLGMGKILAEAAKLRKKPFVKVGITQAKGSRARTDGKKTNAEIAQFHEYGAPNAGIPERSFIRSTVNANQAKYDGQIASLKDQIFDANSDMTVERGLGLVGQSVSSDMKATIRAKIPPPLKDATIRAKNHAQIAKAKAHLDASPSSADFTKRGSAANAKASALVATGGESTPLIDTGQLINAISYAVEIDGQGSGDYEGEGPKTS